MIRTRRRRAPGHRFRAAGLVVAIAVAALAVGCGPSGSSGGSAPGSTQPPPPQYGGSVVVAIAGETDGFNPATSQWSGPAVQMARAVLDPLVVMDREGDWQPYLAQAITPNADFTVWTIDLRPGVRFHNGEALDADALVTFLEAIVSSPLSSQGFPERPVVAASGDLSVTMTFTEPWAQMPTVLAEQPGYVIAPAQVASGDTEHPIGTGPFVFEEWTPDVSFRATRNQDYWRDGLPYLDSIEFRPIPDPSTAKTALVTGLVDIAEFPGIGRTGLDELVSQGFGTTDDVDNAGVINLLMNTRRGATEDPLLREAIVSAIDREQYRDTVLDPSFELADQPYPADDRWHADVDYPEHDPSRAQALVAEYEAEHGPATIEILTVSGPPTTGPEFVQAQLAAVGIDSSIKAVELASFVKQFVTGDFDTVFLGGFLSAADPDGSFPFLVSSNATESAISLNFTGYADDEIDAALVNQRRTDDPTAREAEWARVWQILAEEVPYAFIAHDRYGFAWQTDVHGLTGFTTPDGVPLPAINHWAPFFTAVYLAGEG